MGLNESNYALARVRDVKAQYENALLRKANVVGVGVGFRPETRDLALVVNVTHKVPLSDLQPDDRIPDEIDGVPVRVRAVGWPQIFAQGDKR